MELAAAALLVRAIGCATAPTGGPVSYAQQEIAVDPNVAMTLLLAKPESTAAPPFMVVFASGDGGLNDVSMDLFQHLAERRYWVAGFSSRDAFRDLFEEPAGRPNEALARDSFASIIAQAKRALGLADRTPVLVTGMSRGASVVIASAGDPTFRSDIVGAVAIALTREFDYLSFPAPERMDPGVETDDRGRFETYPAIKRLGSIPLAIIQSTNDSYVPSAESRRLLGPDTATRRLYEVESRNHGFDGGRDALMHDFDDALEWIGSQMAPE